MPPTARTIWCSLRPGFRGSQEPRTIAKKFVALWNEKKHNVGGLTEGFRGWDGINAIAEAIKAAGKAEPEAIKRALWEVKVKGINGDISLHQAGAGRYGKRPERAERLSGQNRRRQGDAAVTGGHAPALPAYLRAQAAVVPPAKRLTSSPATAAGLSAACGSASRADQLLSTPSMP